MTNTKELRCIHRHTIHTHPACFARGLVKGTWKNDKEWTKVTGKPWYTFPEYKVGYLDIETDSLKADFGTILSWAIKEKGGDVYLQAITKEELFREKDVDKELVQSLIEVMNQNQLSNYQSQYLDNLLYILEMYTK